MKIIWHPYLQVVLFNYSKRERKQDMFYVLTKKTNGEAILRKRFRTVGYAERWLAEHFPEWEEKYDLEILY